MAKNTSAQRAQNIERKVSIILTMILLALLVIAAGAAVKKNQAPGLQGNSDQPALESLVDESKTLEEAAE